MDQRNTPTRVEALKLGRSLVGAIATLAMVVGIFALLGGIAAAVAGGNPELIAQVGPAAALHWGAPLAGTAQITAVAGILGFGIVLASILDREFTDRRITGVSVRPISRGHIALTKLTVYALWSTLVIHRHCLLPVYGWPLAPSFRLSEAVRTLRRGPSGPRPVKYRRRVERCWFQQSATHLPGPGMRRL